MAWREPWAGWKAKLDEIQANAVAAMTDALQTQSRVRCLMACGTGKTVVAQKLRDAIGPDLAGNLGAQRCIVFVPTLGLIDQTWKRWMVPNGRPAYAGEVMLVCSASDRRKGADDLSINDLPEQVTTDPEKVAEFLRRPGRRAIFCTYQSAHRIADAMAGGDIAPFDLMVLDEAHWTAGKAGKGYSLPLQDDQIAARYRVAMTATPRHYELPEGGAVSMDDESLFGPVAFEYTTTQAIRDRIIVDYNLRVCSVSRADVLDDIKTDDAVNLAARAIGTVKAIRDDNAVRVLVFVNTIPDGAALTKQINAAYHALPPDQRPALPVVARHVHGDMGKKAILATLEWLGEANTGDIRVLVSAQILSEGIDSPSVDMVVLAAPRRSKSNIVQCHGRGSRAMPGMKRLSLVVLVYISDGADPEEQVARTEWAVAVDVLRAIRAEDGRMEDVIRRIRDAPQVRSAIGDEQRDEPGLTFVRFTDRVLSSVKTMVIGTIVRRTCSVCSRPLPTSIGHRATCSDSCMEAAAARQMDKVQAQIRDRASEIAPRWPNDLTDVDRHRLAAWRKQHRSGTMRADTAAHIETVLPGFGSRAHPKERKQQCGVCGKPSKRSICSAECEVVLIERKHAAELAQFREKVKAIASHNNCMTATERCQVSTWRSEKKRGVLHESRVRAIEEVWPGFVWDVSRGRPKKMRMCKVCGQQFHAPTPRNTCGQECADTAVARNIEESRRRYRAASTSTAPEGEQAEKIGEGRKE